MFAIITELFNQSENSYETLGKKSFETVSERTFVLACRIFNSGDVGNLHGVNNSLTSD